MKKSKIISRLTSAAAAVLISAFCTASLPLAAASPGTASPGAVSPGLEVISGRVLTMAKSCLKNSEIVFSAEDFDSALGTKPESVTIVETPLVTEGRLMLGSLEVMRGQTISRRSLDMLRFVPAKSSASADVREASFKFRGNIGSASEGYEMACSLFVLDELNFAPTAASVDETALCWSTQKDIPVWGTLKAHDPEGDELRFEIVSYPKKGVLTMRTESGDYIYTPTGGYVGRDSFTYAAYDRYGNRSEDIKISLDIDRRACDVEYSDMNGHWAQNAAIKMTAAGIMNGDSSGGLLCFNPNGGVSRLEFLVMAMQASGIEPVKATDTGFFDDDQIPQSYKGYVASAVGRGYVSGLDIDGLRCFCPDNSITRAEAAVILNNMLDAKQPVIKTVFADTTGVPAWAEDALYAMNALGILNGTGEGYIAPYSTLTRAQTAQMLCAVMELRS